VQSVWTACNSGRRGTPSPPLPTTADSSLVVSSSFFFLDPCSDLGQWIRICIQEAVLGIRHILVRIRMRIRILGSVPLTNGSGYGSGMPKKLMDPGPDADSEHWYIYIILQRYNVIKKLQNSTNQGFSYWFCLMMEGSGSVLVITRSGPYADTAGPKHTEPTDPDPQHWYCCACIPGQ
jgi:hypothetical protein